MILSLFGPDGAGKSTISTRLARDGWFVLSGTGVASWPDQSWHEELIAQGIDEPRYDNDAHFLEKIRRVHDLARRLERQHGNVVIDSDPLHKTAMHDVLRGVDRFEELYVLAFPTYENVTHVCVMIDSGDDRADAYELQRRIIARGEHEHFDPKTARASLAMIRATRQIVDTLQSRGDKVVTIKSADRVRDKIKHI